MYKTERSFLMRKNILTLGILTLISALFFSPRFRNALGQTIDSDNLDKMHEMKNVLVDFKKNN